MSDGNENAAVYFIDRHAQSDLANKLAFVEASGQARSLTYAQLARETGKLGDLFRRHGVRREERVAILVLDQIEFPILFWGALKAGVVPVAVNTLLSASAIDAILRDARVRGLFVSRELLEALTPFLDKNPFLEEIFVVGEGAGTSTGYLSFAKELALSEVRPAISVSGDECAFWLYTSGSSGAPKGVRHVHASLKHTSDTYGAKVLEIAADDVVYSAAKLFFAYGLGNAMTFPLSVGATTILLNTRPTPDSVLDVLNRFRPTIFCAVPTLYAALNAKLEASGETSAFSMRRCISAGEALPAEVGRRWKRFTGVDILDGVGSTELLHIFLSNRADSVAYGTSGVAVPGYDIRLVDEADHEVEAGEIGELLVRGDSAAADYWNQRDKSRATFTGAWTRTRDKYEKREDGRLVYCGRTDDLFKVNGMWVSPFEVESALVDHPGVLEAAVVSAPDEYGLEKPRAFVVLKPGTDASDIAALLKDHVKERIGKWKYPRWVVIVPELPKTATGKIERYKLRDGQN